MIERWSGKKIKMGPKCFGEFVGTAVLVLWAMAYWLMCCSGIQGGGWGLVDDIHWLGACYCFRRIAAIACGSPDPALNPAVTLGVAIETGDFSKFGAQMLGAMAGAFLVWLNFLPHWSRTEDPCAKLACFSTMPAIQNFGANLLSETIGTFMLVLGVAAISSKQVAISGPAAGLGPYLAGLVVWGIVLSLGGTTGCAINPARDLGPRIVHSFLPLGKKVGSGWSYAIVPVMGPLIGAGLAGLFVRLAHF
jgi:glycerol uptake facilitator protein